MKIETATLPTHLALVARRLNLGHSDDLATCFLNTSYLAEVALKSIAIVLHSGLEKPAREIAYRHAYGIVRADGLGIWELSVRDLTTSPTSSYLPPEYSTLLTWMTKKRTKPEDETFRGVLSGLRSLLLMLGTESDDAPKAPTFRDLLTLFVQIRNKTKAHGAVGDEFYSNANGPYFLAVKTLVESCPAFSWRWLHLSKRDSGKVRAISLLGFEPTHIKESELALRVFEHSGIFVSPDQSTRLFHCGLLLKSNRDCTSFLIPNGGMKPNGTAEFLDYATGAIEQIDASQLTSPPAQRPRSETEGLSKFDVQSNVFGNLPPLSPSYVRRNKLEQELTARLSDKNHPIITLHGGGGMGKTSLAIKVTHDLAEANAPLFEHIVWFSARDVDLRPTGPSEVRQSVVDLKTVSQRFGELFSMYSVGNDASALARALETPTGISEKGILFIFDNFETMSDVRGLHRFLDEHTHLPNKVLITSRDRAFVADYPIEVFGMEFPEAREMLLSSARELMIEGLMTETVIQNIYKFTNGHAYVMRVIAGEMAKDGRYTPPAQLVGRRSDIVDTVFERSFNKLSDAGRNVFLIVSNWRAEVAELGMFVVLGLRGIDAERGIDECLRLSLIHNTEIPGGSPSYSVPQLARAFGQKKLQGDPDRLVIQEDLVILRRFGSHSISSHNSDPRSQLISQFTESCTSELGNEPEAISRSDKLLEGLALLWPSGWLHLAEFREKSGAASEQIEYALRRAVEELPYSKEAWIRRATFAERTHDDATRIASLVSAVEADPADIELVREVALQLCNYVNEHITQIPKARRGVYLASVRAHMEKLAKDLDATGLSRLAWLFLLEGNVDQARNYADWGCARDPCNTHCIRILKRLEGYQ